MILPILRWPDPPLSTPCAPVGGRDVAALAADMLETMYAAPGRGLAAPQVGVLLRLFVMDTGWKEGTPAPRICLDPVVEFIGDFVEGPESCLSLPGIVTRVARAERVALHWTTPDGDRRSEVLDGFAAVCAQHEADHLDGRMTLDHLTPEARAAALAGYA